MQTDIRREFRGLCKQLSEHELKQNPELGTATRALKRALKDWNDQIQEEEKQELMEVQSEKGNA